MPNSVSKRKSPGHVIHVGTAFQDTGARLKRCRNQISQVLCHAYFLLPPPLQAELYTALGEEDVLAGLWKRRCRTEDTRAGLGLVQAGLLPAAQDIFLDACRKGWQEGSASLRQL